MDALTVSSEFNRQDFTVGGPGPVSFSYRLDTADELELWVRDADGLREFKAILNTDYTVSIAADFASANVTLLAQFVTAYMGRDCSLIRVALLTQPLNVSQVQRFTDGELEKGYDRSVMRDQQLVELIGETKAQLEQAIEDTNNPSAAASATAAAASAAAAAASAAQAAGAPSATANFDWFQNG